MQSVLALIEFEGIMIIFVAFTKYIYFAFDVNSINRALELV